MHDCPVCGRENVRLRRVKRRPNALCPCGSRERHRIIAVVLRDEGIHSPHKKQIYHLAQFEKALARFIFRNRPQNSRAVSGNLLNIAEQHAADSLDFIVHNHVMEHVKQHEAAYRGQFCVLRPGGKLVFTIPLRPKNGGTDDETLEFDRPLNKAERRKHYGQHNHVRFYGLQDTLDLLTKIGFDATYKQFGKIYGDELVQRYATSRGGAFVAIKPRGREVSDATDASTV